MYSVIRPATMCCDGDHIRFPGKADWWGRQDSNLRRLSQWIYSRMALIEIAVEFPDMSRSCRIYFRQLGRFQFCSIVSFREDVAIEVKRNYDAAVTHQLLNVFRGQSCSKRCKRDRHRAKKGAAVCNGSPT